MGVAAGVTALAPATKALRMGAKGKGNVLDAWTKPRDPTIYPVRILTRKPGSHLLPLSQRPFLVSASALCVKGGAK